jgi:hypothetical protein
MAKISSSNELSIPDGAHDSKILSRCIVGGRPRKSSARDAFENVSVEMLRLSKRVETARKDEKESKG